MNAAVSGSSMPYLFYPWRRWLARYVPQNLGFLAARTRIADAPSSHTNRAGERLLHCLPLALVVLVESYPALATEASGGNVAPQERAGPVLGVPEALVQDLHDMQARIQADEVGKRQGAHRVVHP